MAQRFFEGAAHAALYAKFRPSPPPSLVARVVDFTKEKRTGPLEAAADIGCGSGQGTKILCPFFKHVTGLDVSEAQISEAQKNNTETNVSYGVSPAETLPFTSGSLSLVTSYQACHWFDLPAFYKEVDRVLAPGGVLALCGEALPKPVHDTLADELFDLINHVYEEDTKGCWGAGIVDLDNAYSDPKFTIPYLDFHRDDTHYFDMAVTVSELVGFITTWSGFQNYRSKYGDEAAQKILTRFEKAFMDTLGVSTPADETSITLRYRYFLLMGSKPVHR